MQISGLARKGFLQLSQRRPAPYCPDSPPAPGIEEASGHRLGCTLVPFLVLELELGLAVAQEQQGRDSRQRWGLSWVCELSKSWVRSWGYTAGLAPAHPTV